MIPGCPLKMTKVSLFPDVYRVYKYPRWMTIISVDINLTVSFFPDSNVFQRSDKISKMADNQNQDIQISKMADNQSQDTPLAKCVIIWENMTTLKLVTIMARMSLEDRETFYFDRENVPRDWKHIVEQLVNYDTDKLWALRKDMICQGFE